jgi:hypothetical protein
MLIEPLLNYDLILEKSDNIFINIIKPKKEKIVLYKTEEHEGIGDNYYSILKHDNKIKLYYRALNIKNFYISSEEAQNYEYTCYAESYDGLNFIKPQINDNSNIIFKNGLSHNFSIFNVNNKLYGLGGTAFTNNGSLSLAEEKNNKWFIMNPIIAQKDILPDFNHINHFDSHNIVIYDDICNNYKIYLRDNKKSGRHVQYSVTNDLQVFDAFKNIDINYEGEIYTSNFIKYPDSKYYIGFPSTHIQENFNKKSMLVFSLDGCKWKVLDNNLCNDINTSYMIQYGMIDINNKFYIYIRDDAWNLETNNLVCYSFDYHRMQEIKTNELGYVTIGPFDIKTLDIYLNYKTFDDGFIIIELQDNDKNILLSSEKLKDDYYFNKIIWKNDIIINKEQYILKITMKKCSLYSIKFN